MPFLKSYPDDADPVDIYTALPEVYEPWMQVQNAVMRGPSPLTAAEREMIAAYTSGLNACQYCYGGHIAIAEALGVEEGLIDDMVQDLDSAPVPERLKPLLRYAGKLTLQPARMTDNDAQAVYNAGWDERALHDTVAVCAMFNFMNRLVDGLGIKPAPTPMSGDAAKKALAELDYISIVRQAQAARAGRGAGGDFKF